MASTVSFCLHDEKCVEQFGVGSLGVLSFQWVLSLSFMGGA